MGTPERGESAGPKVDPAEVIGRYQTLASNLQARVIYLETELSAAMRANAGLVPNDRE